MQNTTEAEAWKKKGNEFFGAHEWENADRMYSQAIICDSSIPGTYTNRALVRLKMQRFDECITDCEIALSLKNKSPLHEMRAEYYLGQALNHLSRPNEALIHCSKAYEMAIEQNSPSTTSIAQTVLEAKKKRWEGQERRRIDKEASLMNDMKQLIRSDMEQRIVTAREQSHMMSGIEGWSFADETALIRREAQERCDALEAVFARAEPDKYAKREVPDYLIDAISFNIMVDPWMTKSGQSYDKHTILNHLKRSETDPLTRERLREADLRPNNALKHACADFVDQNGWAADY